MKAACGSRPALTPCGWVPSPERPLFPMRVPGTPRNTPVHVECKHPETPKRQPLRGDSHGNTQAPKRADETRAQVQTPGREPTPAATRVAHRGACTSHGRLHRPDPQASPTRVALGLRRGGGARGRQGSPGAEPRFEKRAKEPVVGVRRGGDGPAPASVGRGRGRTPGSCRSPTLP